MNKKSLFLSAVLLPSSAAWGQQVAATLPVLRPAAVRRVVPNPTSRSGKALVIAPAPNPSTREAIEESEDWQRGDAVPVLGKNGAVQFDLGAGMPSITCSPDRLCEVLLETGEKITDQPVLGDSSRWDYTVMKSGTGSNERVHVVVKLKKPRYGIKTDLMIATDRRLYHLEFVSSATQYVARAEFTYGDEPNSSWIKYQAEQQEQKEKREESKPPTGVPLASALNLDYTVKVSHHHPDADFIPKWVGRDTEHTYLKMPKELQSSDTPILQVSGANGCEIVPYRVVGDDHTLWKIDGKLVAGTLIYGGDKKHRQLVQFYQDGHKDELKCGKIKQAEVAVNGKKVS
jgi:P-type conjugative transfer protein TrbG